MFRAVDRLSTAVRSGTPSVTLLLATSNYTDVVHISCMAREQSYECPPETAFRACITAVAYLPWAIDERDESTLRMTIRTPFTIKKTKPSFQDVVTAEVIPKDGRSIVWVDSYPRFQVWNWGKDARNERAFLEAVTREVERATTGTGPDATEPPARAEPTATTPNRSRS